MHWKTSSLSFIEAVHQWYKRATSLTPPKSMSEIIFKCKQIQHLITEDQLNISTQVCCKGHPPNKHWTPTVESEMEKRGKVLRISSWHGQIAASVLFRLFSGNYKCHTTEVILAHERNSYFKCKQHTFLHMGQGFPNQLRCWKMSSYSPHVRRVACDDVTISCAILLYKIAFILLGCGRKQ